MAGAFAICSSLATSSAWATGGEDRGWSAEAGKSAEAKGRAVATPAPAPVSPTTTSTTVVKSSAPGSTVTPKDCPNTFTGVNTGNGANTSGAYDSTCNGTPALNGNSDSSNASSDDKGKPCAGCVGNADFKNPPGQAPDGSDGNNGYECDGNNGIGKTNPAHTGCKPTAASVTTTIVPPTTKTAAPKTISTPVAEVLGVQVVPTTTVVGSAEVSAAALARTGTNAGPMVMLGLSLAALGALALLVARFASQRPSTK